MRSVTSLSTRLLALLGLPLILLVALAGSAVLRASDAAAASRSAARSVELSLAAANAARAISLEGDLSASVLSTSEPPPPQSASPTTPSGGSLSTTAENTPEALEQQRRATDETVDALHSAADDAATAGLGPALDGLDRLETTRDAIDEGRHETAQVTDSYEQLAGPVLGIDRMLDGTGNPRIISQLTAHLALTRAIQAVAREQRLVTSMLESGVVDPGGYGDVVEILTSEQHWLGQFESSASAGDLESYREAQSSPSMTTARRLRESALAAGPGGSIEGSPTAWSNASGRRLDMLSGIADETAANLTALAEDQQSASDARRSRTILVFLGALGLAAAALFLLYRFVLAPLRRLAAGCVTAIEESVPKAVDLVETDGEQVARAALTVLPTTSSAHELRQLAKAVNVLQDRAVDLALESAALRGDVNSVFLNFGRRTQSLVDHQLSHIDSLEARTDNPDTLADLFLLDHLTTRLRRNAESLVVLAGADSPRPWSRPVSVVNVVRAGVAEAADYSRVDLSPMPPANIAGSCANDISHLLAELVDNALACSYARVTIGGDEQTDGHYVVTVSDAGTGMSTRQLADANERIAHTPVADVGTARYFGLFVVGRLARRHGIDVQLRPGRTRGVTAEVTLPPSLMVAGTQVSTPAAVASTPDDLTLTGR